MCPLAVQVGDPLAWQLVPKEPLQAMQGDRLQALTPGERAERGLGVARRVRVLGPQPVQRHGNRIVLSAHVAQCQPKPGEGPADGATTCEPNDSIFGTPGILGHARSANHLARTQSVNK
jgi:hypothetical protein